MKKLRFFVGFALLLGISFVTSQTAGESRDMLVFLSPAHAAWFKSADRLDQLEVLQQIVNHIHESYVEPNRVDPSAMLKKALDDVSQTVAEVRVLHPDSDKAVIVVDKARMEVNLKVRSVYNLAPVLSDALKFIRANKKSDVSDRDLEVTAINGLLSTLDPHSVYLTTDMYNETKVGTTGKFGGLGIVIGLRESKLIVIAPLENTPAFNAGLKSGDFITKINDEPTVNMSLSEAVDKMRGPKGSAVTITVMRTNWTQPKPFTLIRDIINVVSVDSELLPNSIGYVRLKSFQGNSEKELARHLKELTRKAGGLKGLILDLRGDPGGLLDQAVGVSDKFLADGSIVTTVGAGNKIRDEEKATGPGTEPNYPMAVLVDQGSASASEIVAGALKRRDRAIILGQKTFGKGTVQSLFELPEDSALKLTIAQYLTPGDVSIQSIGVSPDVKLNPAIVSKEFIDLFRKREYEGEVDLERHFDNPRQEHVVKEKEPEVQLTYLEKLDDSEDARLARAAGTQTPEEMLKDDFYVRVAHDLLKDHPQATKQELLKYAKTYAVTSNKAENQKVIEALKEKGIDWTPLASKQSAKKCAPPTAAWRFDPAKSGPLTAGETVKLVLTMSNPSTCTLFQARASTESKNYLFNNHEFLFGRLPPNSTATREAKIVIPKFMPSSFTSFTFTFVEAQGITPKGFDAVVATRPVSKPKFEFAYEMKDADGLVTRGERLDLTMRVKNVGQAPSEESSASIRAVGDHPVTIPVGRVPMAKLKVGEERTVAFQVDVPKNYSENSFQIDMQVMDPAFRVTTSKRMTFDLALPAQLTKREEAHETRQKQTVVRALPSSTSSAVARVEGKKVVSVTGQYGDYYRIDLGKGRSGWIETAALQSSRAAGMPGAVFHPHWMDSPRITMEDEKWIYTPVQNQFLSVKGNVADDEQIKDVFVFVNGKKVSYQSYPADEKSPNRFESSLPLDPGLNRIVVVARDNQDLLSQESYVVERRTTDKESEAIAKKGMNLSHEEFLSDPTSP
jgi:carboxyl-terminal processing protease